MGKGRYQLKKQRRQEKMEREREIEKKYLNQLKTIQKPDDQKSLYDRLGNQDPKVREMAYITLSTLKIGGDTGLNNEIFNINMTKRIINSLSDPIKKNSLCVFAIISNVLDAADGYNKFDILTSYIENGLLDTLGNNVQQIMNEINENSTDISNSDLEKNIWYVEESYKLLDGIVLLQNICVEDNLDLISQHNTLMEITITLMTQPNKLLLSGGLMYWLTHFLYSLTQDNSPLGLKLKEVNELDSFIQLGLAEINETTLHICSNLMGLSTNIYLQTLGGTDFESETFKNYIETPLVKTLMNYSSPQQEFISNFSENLETIKDSLSSSNENEDAEESITTEKKEPSVKKLGQILTNFLNEMSAQVNIWKNYGTGNVTALEVLKSIISDNSRTGDESTPESQEYIAKLFTSELTINDASITLFDGVLERLKSIQLNLKVKFEDLQGIGESIIDVQTEAGEVLISLLLSHPELLDADTTRNKQAIEAILLAIKHQSYDSMIVEAGLRFVALFSKNHPDILQEVLDLHQANDSFLTLIESVRDPEMIANGLSIISTTFKDVTLSSDQNEKILKMLLKHIDSGMLRIICESLNAMFDLYADERYDSILSSYDVITNLENAIEKLYAKIEQEQDDFDQGEIEYFQEVVDNLEQFGKYKRENMQ